MQDFAKKRLVAILMAFLLALTAFLLTLIARQDFSLRGYSDSFFVAGVLPLAYAVLFLIARTGIFDVFQYGMMRFGETFQRKKEKRWDSAYDFKIHKAEKRRLNKPVVWPYFVIAAFLILIALILALIYR